MVADGGLRDAELVGELADAIKVIADGGGTRQKLEDAETHGVAEGLVGDGEGFDVQASSSVGVSEKIT